MIKKFFLTSACALVVSLVATQYTSAFELSPQVIDLLNHMGPGPVLF